MRQHKSTIQGMHEAFREVVAKNAIPSPSELVIELADIEERKQQLVHLLKLCRDSLQRQLDEAEYQSMMDYLYLKAAKKNIDSGDLVAEMEFKFMVQDLRDLPERNLWEAMKFIQSYE